jgi:outer membrane protein TolC
MNRRIKNIAGLLVAMSLCIFAYGQGTNAAGSVAYVPDSLSIQKVITEVVSNFPTVRQAAEAINAAEARVSLAKTGYYPDVSVSAAYTRLGPVTEISIPNMGQIQLFPADNYSAAVNYHQNVYDFGKTSKNVALEKENKALAELSLDQVKQNLSLTVVGNFFTLAFLQEAIVIKGEELRNLQEHLEFVQKKKETGSATQYELLSTQVRISAVESQQVDLQTAQTVQLSILNNMLGLPENTDHKVRYDLNTALPQVQEDSMVTYAIKHRDEMMIAEKKTDVAEFRYKAIKAQNNPVFDLYASGGAKNGYFPDLNTPKMNYTVGAGIRVPLYDASRTKYSLQMANSSILTSGYETETTRRIVTNDVVENETRMKAARQKVVQYQLQQEQAQQAYDLAQTNFKAGAITNLDLLDASTILSESSLLLLKARIDYIASIYKLQASLGLRLY